MYINISPSGQTYSYLALRRAIGWIGISLPFLLMLGRSIFFGDEFTPVNISMYYYTGMRDVFVGSLCAIGLFLFFYRGYDKLDNIAANIAGSCAVMIAWFPTTKIGPLDLPGIIHFLAAIVFFLVLAGYSLFLFTRKGPDPTPQKLKRNKIYVLCGLVMVFCLAIMMLYFCFFQVNYPESGIIFWVETVALVAFGVSWLTKGGTLYPDKTIIREA